LTIRHGRNPVGPREGPRALDRRRASQHVRVRHKFNVIIQEFCRHF